MMPSRGVRGNEDVARTPVRATQGFVDTLNWTWRRPYLTLIEIAWRWIFGIPALWLCYREGSRILAEVPWKGTGVQAVTINELLTDPMRASITLADFAGLVLPGVAHALLWLGPLLLVAWIVISAAGRTFLLQRIDPALQARPVTMIVLQAARLVPLIAIAWTWWSTLQWLGRYSILQPIEKGGEPSMMLYVGGLIVLSLGLFVLAAAVGWVFALAPLLAMRDGSGAIASLRKAAGLRNVRGSLVEINLVLSVVKIMLLVLAMAFSAFPLPFASVITPEYIAFWSFLIGVLYFAGSDFFHVTRLTGYLHLLRRHQLTQSVPGASE